MDSTNSPPTSNSETYPEHGQLVPVASTNQLALQPHIIIPNSRTSPWLPILEASNQLVLYNPTSHALSITPPSALPSIPVHHHPRQQTRQGDELGLELEPAGTGVGAGQICPYCSGPLTRGRRSSIIGGPSVVDPTGTSTTTAGTGSGDRVQGYSRRAPNYFQLLEMANLESNSRPTSPPIAPSPLESPALDRIRAADSMPGTPKPRFGDSSMAQGYFSAFFREEKRLGMGANGSVYLCQVNR